MSDDVDEELERRIGEIVQQVASKLSDLRSDLQESREQAQHTERFISKLIAAWESEDPSVLHDARIISEADANLLAEYGGWGTERIDS